MNYIIIFFTVTLFFISCADKEHKEIGFNIPGIETRVSRVLINRNSFEGAVIKILGRVRNLNFSEGDNSIASITQFSITDPKGNYINVRSNEKLELKEDDVIIVSGQYSSSTNTINLHDFEIIKPSIQ